MDDVMTPSEWVEWKKKRKYTFVGFIIVGTAVAIERSVVFSTLYFYLRDFIKTDKPELYFGIITAAYFGTGSLSGIFFGRWLDKTRKVRVFVYISLFILIIGFIIYAIPYHPAQLLVARILCGVGIPFLSVVTGEIVRTYDSEESTRALFWLASTYSFGFIIGPSLNWLFNGIHFYLGWLEINHLNFIGIFMTVLLLSLIIVVYLLIHDCSAQFDLKEYLQNKFEKKERVDCVAKSCFGGEYSGRSSERTKLLTTPDYCKREPEPSKLIFKRFSTDRDIILIFLMSFVYMYGLYTVMIMIPIIVPNILRWSATAINAAYVGYGIGDLFLLVTTARYCKTDTAIYYCSVASMLTNSCTFCLLLCISILPRSYSRDITLFVSLAMFLFMAWLFDNVLVRVLLAKRVPSNIQSFSEGLRSGVGNFARILGSLSASVISAYLEWWSIALLISVFVLLILFIIRRESFLKPAQIKIT